MSDKSKRPIYPTCEEWHLLKKKYEQQFRAMANGGDPVSIDCRHVGTMKIFLSGSHIQDEEAKASVLDRLADAYADAEAGPYLDIQGEPIFRWTGACLKYAQRAAEAGDEG